MNERKNAVKTNRLQKEMQFDGVTVLTYEIEYPELNGPNYRLAQERLNRHFRAEAEKYREYVESKLYAEAVEQYKELQKEDYPERAFDVKATFRVTFFQKCIVSLYFDRYEYTGGAHGNTIRSAETWDLQGIRRMSLADFVSDARCRERIILQIQAQAAACPEVYLPGYAKLIKQYFNEEQFYCIGSGLMIFYQQYDIAPYASGIREFLIPYGGCVAHPISKCFHVPLTR